ncbi:hypothetical protein FKM82_005355 [Ascaphus truei]
MAVANICCAYEMRPQATWPWNRSVAHCKALVGDPGCRKVCNCNKYIHISRDRVMHLLKLNGYPTGTQEEEAEPQEPAVPSPSVANPSKESLDSQDLQWMEEFGLSPGSLALPSGAHLHLESIPVGLLAKIDLFYCCSQCGKVFWEGSHFGRLVSQFKEVLQDTGEGFYQVATQGL